MIFLWRKYGRKRNNSRKNKSKYITEMSKREFEFTKLNPDLFKDIKFIKKRKTKRKWLTQKSRIRK